MKTKVKAVNRKPNARGILAGLLTLPLMSGILTPVSFANVVGSDMQNFNATTSGLDFVTVESAETLQPGFFNFGLFMNYAVNTLPYFEATETYQSRSKFNDTVLGADLNVGYGVSQNFDLGLSMPQVVASSVKRNAWNGKFRDTGNTEVRANAKYKLTGDDKDGVAIQGIVSINRTKDNPYVGKSNDPMYSMILIGTKQVTNEVGLGINLGYRWRKPGEALPDSDPIKPLVNQYIWSAAANYRIESIDSKIIAEVFGSNPIKPVSTNSDRTSSSAESIIGIKHDIDTNLAVHAGFGTELSSGLSSPDWRIYAGINYATGPKMDQPVRVTTIDPPATTPAAEPFNVEPKAYESIVVHDVMFEFDSDHLVLNASKNMLKGLADHLRKPPEFTKLIVVGHTDSIGSVEYNDDLSKRRAQTIKNWLVNELGLSAAKIAAEGHGEREPVAGNGNYQGRQLNRRVEFKIYRDGIKDEIRSQSNPKAAETAKDPVLNGEKAKVDSAKGKVAAKKPQAKPAKIETKK